jgi:hypothetical protein
LTQALAKALIQAFAQEIGGGLIPAEQSEAMAGRQQLQRGLEADTGTATGEQQVPWLPSGAAVSKPLLSSGSSGIGHGVRQLLKAKSGRHSSLPVICQDLGGGRCVEPFPT